MIIGKNVIVNPSVKPILNATTVNTEMIIITVIMTADIRATSSKFNLDK